MARREPRPAKVANDPRRFKRRLKKVDRRADWRYWLAVNMILNLRLPLFAPLPSRAVAEV
jgi:hypothetical protein